MSKDMEKEGVNHQNNKQGDAQPSASPRKMRAEDEGVKSHFDPTLI